MFDFCKINAKWWTIKYFLRRTISLLWACHGVLNLYFNQIYQIDNIVIQFTPNPQITFAKVLYPLVPDPFSPYYQYSWAPSPDASCAYALSSYTWWSIWNRRRYTRIFYNQDATSRDVACWCICEDSSSRWSCRSCICSRAGDPVGFSGDF